MMVAHLTVLPQLVLLLGAALLPLRPRWLRAENIALAALGLAFALWLPLAQRVLSTGPVSYHLGGWPPAVGIEVVSDTLSVYFGGIVFLLSLPAATFACSSLAAEVPIAAHSSFWTLYLLLVMSLLALSLAADLFNTYVFIEISSLAACALIATVNRPLNIEATFKYLILSTVGSGCILMATLLLYMLGGQLNLSLLAQALPQQAALFPKNLIAAGTFLLVGLGVKSALFPLHSWLPDTHSVAPSPASALLSGLVVKIYVLVLLRVAWGTLGGSFLSLLPFQEVLLFLATVSIFLGSIFAIAQSDLKRMLAYSTVAQMGYVFLGLAANNETAFTGAVLHLFNHAILKATLFLAAGGIIWQTGERRLRNLVGVGHRCPIALSAFSLAALGMIGIPGTAGFTSKWFLVVGCLQGGTPVLAWVILLSSLLNAIYYLPVVILGFFGHSDQCETRFHLDQMPLGLLIPICFLALCTLFFGLWPSPPLVLAQDIAYQFFYHGR
jgi:multicomponent Na+:H+ antiporter subunit D